MIPTLGCTTEKHVDSISIVSGLLYGMLKKLQQTSP